MLPAVMASVIVVPQSIGRFGSRYTDGAGGMSEPGHRVAADGAIAFRDVRPLDVLAQPEKNARGALVCTIGQHDFVTFLECRTSRFSAHHVCLPPSFSISSYGRNCCLFTTLAFSSLARSVSFSRAVRSISLCGASFSSSRAASAIAV